MRWKWRTARFFTAGQWHEQSRTSNNRTALPVSAFFVRIIRSSALRIRFTSSTFIHTDSYIRTYIQNHHFSSLMVSRSSPFSQYNRKPQLQSWSFHIHIQTFVLFPRSYILMKYCCVLLLQIKQERSIRWNAITLQVLLLQNSIKQWK